jgi:hypothetical protein
MNCSGAFNPVAAKRLHHEVATLQIVGEIDEEWGRWLLDEEASGEPR